MFDDLVRHSFLLTPRFARHNRDRKKKYLCFFNDQKMLILFINNIKSNNNSFTT